MIQEPNPPFFELHFYYHELDDKESFNLVLNALLSQGATLTNKGSIYSGKDISQVLFGFVYEIDTIEIDVSKTDIRNSDVFPINVYLKDAIQSGFSDTSEILTYCGISDESSKLGKHPVSILADGSTVDLYFNAGTNPELAKWQLRELYNRFIAINEDTDPSYSILTSEEWLPVPHDLKKDTEFIFSDFYVSNRLGDETIRAIKHLYKDAYQTELQSGVYISTSGLYNTEAKKLPSEIVKKNHQVLVKYLCKVLK